MIEKSGKGRIVRKNISIKSDGFLQFDAECVVKRVTRLNDQDVAFGKRRG